MTIEEFVMIFLTGVIAYQSWTIHRMVKILKEIKNAESDRISAQIEYWKQFRGAIEEQSRYIGSIRAKYDA